MNVPQWVKDALPGREIVSCSVDGDSAVVVVKVKYAPGQTGPEKTLTIGVSKSGGREWSQG